MLRNNIYTDTGVARKRIEILLHTTGNESSKTSLLIQH